MKITILGGGIGGLTTAIALKNAGISCEVYETAEKFKPVGAGLSIAINAMKALEYLGLHTPVLEKGNQYAEGKMLSTKGKTLQTLPMDKLRKKFNNTAVAIHRHELHDILANNLGDIPVHFNKKCINMERSEKGIHLSFQDGTHIVTGYLIAADGIHSVIRKKLLPNSSPRFSKQTCWRGVCEKEIPGLDYTVLSETWGLGTRFGIVPLSNKRAYWFAVKDAPKEENIWATYTPAQLADLFKDYHSPVKEIILNTPASAIFWNNLSDLTPIKQFAFDNILLLGDAAHATTPNLGQGACMAIEDAAVLQSLLKKEKDLIKVFQQFEKERIQRTTKIVNTSYQFGKLAQTSNPVLAGLRNMIFPLLPDASNNSLFKFLFGIQFDQR
jgi:2-polyprenyl-6-methoxyphenol hydroxylase-like FAD-dependent oxidoreductase